MLVSSGLGEEGDKQQEFGVGRRPGLGKCRLRWKISSRRLAVMTIHLSYIALKKKKKVARVQRVECRRPHVFIFAVPGPCVRRYSELESCGTENNICLSQAPEEIVALARRGRGQIQRGRKKSAPVRP